MNKRYKVSKDKRKKWEEKYQHRHQEYLDRLRVAANSNTERLYRYNEVDGTNAHLIPKSELQENFYGFTKWLYRNHAGKIVYVALENGCYVIHWKGETRNPVEACSTFDGIPIKCLRVKEGEIII